MILHAIWTGSQLHLWGESYHVDPNHDKGLSLTTSSGDYSVSHVELRRHVGDIWDSLLVSGAQDSSLSLLLPHDHDNVIPSRSYLSDQRDAIPRAEMKLKPFAIESIAFSPADAVDFLGSLPSFIRMDVKLGTSLHYWSKVSLLVLNLLASQRFVPAVHAMQLNGDSPKFRGFWRVVVDDEQTSKRLRDLIASMPPSCRSMEDMDHPIQASSLVESFLWQAVDSLVRRCMDGDELAHAIQDRTEIDLPPQMRWLQSLVGQDSLLHGSTEEQLRVYHKVRDWLSRLEPSARESSSRTCFRLHTPQQVDGESSSDPIPDQWRLTLHVQSRDDENLLLDASRLAYDIDQDPRVLQRPFDQAEAQLRLDVAEVAKYFPPLTPCAQESGPYEIMLTMDEAYKFLRDTVPKLEAEKFGVYLPSWWKAERPRFTMQLEIKPIKSDSNVGLTTMRLDSLVSYDWRIAVGDQDLTIEEVEKLATSVGPLLYVRGQWTEIQPTDLQKTLSFLEKSRSGKMTVFEAMRLCYIADDLETGIPIGGIRAHGWINRLLNASEPDEQFEVLNAPKKFIGELRPYQHKGVSWLLFLSRIGLGACLADDMGLGKTIQFIGLLLLERESPQEPVGPTLLVVPTSLVGNWQREIEKFSPSLRVMVHHGMERLTGQEFIDEVVHHDVVISTYALTYRDYDHLVGVQWHRLALDEAQNIKNPAAKQSQAIRSIPAIQRVALTGTPVENHLSELWSIIDFLNAGYLGTAADFRKRFAVPIERYHDAERAVRLKNLIRPFVLRRLKSDPTIIDDLPEKMEMKVYCNLTPEQAMMYESVVNEMIGQIDRSDGIQRRGLILATLVKLKQLCNHPVQLLRDGSALMNRSGKCNRLTEMLEVVLAEGDRALIFTQFREMGNLLQKILKEMFGKDVLFLHGGTSRLKRDQMVERFQSYDKDSPLFLLSLKAGGFGLNLTAANHVFHYDRWWNPAVEDQATDRAHRIGQNKQVQVHKFVCIGTLEEKIDALLDEKRILAENIIGTGEKWLTELSTNQLRNFFTLSREAVSGD